MLIARWWHQRGFGVQSPWAYELVRDALFDRHRFYAFDTLGGTPADEQLFRLANWLKPTVMMQEGMTDKGREYVQAACPTVRILPWDERNITNEACVVVEQIHRQGRTCWQQVLAHPRTTSSFDLGHRGIAFFDPCRQHQTYFL
mgnify:CR=1 FL=1